MGLFNPSEGKRFFGEEIEKLVATMEASSDFVSNLSETGGVVDIIVHLPGDVNIGDVIPWQILARIAALKANLGIEVFPQFN